MKLDILAISAHPDDVELSCSGTILKHIELGYKVGILDLTAGELGTRGSAELRKEEATEAARVMGLSARENIGIPDGFFTHSRENLIKIIEVIRHFQPEMIFANAIDDRHPDHGRAAKLVADACFLSGLKKIETKREAAAQDKWRPRFLYHYIQDRYRKPDFVVDISNYMEAKMASIMAYKSQFFNPDSSEPVTPISGKEFIEFLKGRAREMGRPAGYEFAEGFNVARTPGIQDLFHLD
ncbi:MAG: bacillithiol biosynthesis deacetylase BshB1 [Bacteroidota bacterium]